MPGEIQIVGGREVRCPYCRKLLAKGEVARGTKLEMPCSRSKCAANMMKPKQLLKFEWR